ncbi:FecR family protein [Steroidobacter sp.]|uniref:FecR family protein n=1 Tax=Steroidobacter sp. TaxID=1978227 RepID=UPI001A4BE313|nr:FecR domain-containing protein [Steroidobacter sp.]MBL8268146.1 FecR domain-containing protein [Steroidobacter sp.]
MTVPCTKEQAREAAVWMTLLHSPDRNERVDRGFRRWLATHPGNARAFDAASRGWEAAGLVPKGSFPHHLAAKKERGTGWLRPAAAMAIIAVFSVAAVLWQAHFGGVSTEIGEQRILTLEDGTRIFLNTDTRVVLDYNAQRRAVELKSGEAYFDVAKRGPEWPFVVIAGEKQINAVGTAFVVRRDADRLLVTLVEGKVTVNEARHPEAGIVKLTPGQRLTVAAQLPPRVDEPPLEKVTSWRTGFLDLPIMPLSEAVAEMNRYSQEPIRLASPEDGEVEVSGVFRTGDNRSFAHAVAESYGFRVVMEKGGITLKK